MKIAKKDLDFFNTWIDKGIIDRLNNLVEKGSMQLTCNNAIELLQANKKFEFTT